MQTGRKNRILSLHSPDICRELTAIYLSFMLLVFPLFTGFSGYADITESKYLLFCIASGIYLIVLLLWHIISKSHITINIGCIFALIFGCTAALSTILSQYRSEALIGASRYDGLVTQLLYCLLFIAVSQYGRWRKEYAVLLSISSGICAVIAILQLLDFNFLWLYPGNYSYYDGDILYTGKFLGPLGNVDVASAFYCLAVPCSFLLPVLSSDKKAYLADLSLFPCIFTQAEGGSSGGSFALIILFAGSFLFICRDSKKLQPFLHQAAVCAAAVLLSSIVSFDPEAGKLGFAFGRKAFLLTAVCLILSIAVIFLKKNISYNPQRFLAVSLPLYFLIFAAGILYLYCGSFAGGTLYELHSVLHGTVQDSFGSSRIGIWKNILKLFPQHPILGGGPDTLVKHVDMEFSRYIDQLGKTRVTYIDNAHNEYLGYLINTGLLGLVSYLGMMFSSFRRSAGKDTAVIPLLSALCYAIEAFFGIGLCFTVSLFILMIAMLNSDMQGESHEE